MENIFAIAGIVATLLGACFAWAASVQRPAPITDPGSDVPIKEMFESGHKARISNWDGVTPERREEEFKKSEEKRALAYKQLTERIYQAWWNDRQVMVKRNTIALFLILGGSVLQGVAILIS